MLGHLHRSFLAVVLACTLAGVVSAGEILSTMRNVNAVAEAHGYRLNIVYDVEAPQLSSDLSPAQVFEIIRPDDKPVTIGRLFTSCTCIQLESPKRTFAAGERAILTLRNIRPTPPAGQVYALFVQITSPVRTTLRFNTYVQSGMADGAPFERSEGDSAAAPGAADSSEKKGASSGGYVGTANADAVAALTRQIDQGFASATSRSSGSTSGESDGSASGGEGSAVTMSEDELDRQLRVDGGEAADDGIVSDDEMTRRVESGEDVLGTADFVEQLEREVVESGGGVVAPIVLPPVTGDEGGVDEVGMAGENLPPPPGLVSPEGDELGVALVESSSEVGGGVLPAPTVMGSPYLVESGAGFEAGVPEPRPEREPGSRKPVQAVSLITVGVRDMPASIRFYEALGWRRAARGKYDLTAFFQLQGQILALYPIHDLLLEQNMPDAVPSPGGITLALHVQDRADVWAVYERFIEAGGTSLRAPAEMASGAVTSYVADPDGNAWEISWVPQFRIDDEGGLWLP